MSAQRRPPRMVIGAAVRAVVVASCGRAAYRLLVSGGLTVDTGRGRRVRPLGPFGVEMAAPPNLVFDLISEPYLKRTPRAMASKLEVLERGTDMVLAAHHTSLRPGLTATTVETVRFSRPHRIDFRLVRGPVPHVVEHFLLHATDTGTTLQYGGELGTDFGAVGGLWGRLVAARWEAAVRATFDSVKAEAERRAAAGSAAQAQ